VENPEFMGLHYMSADDVEECWQLLRQTMKSISYESLAYLPTYSRWLQGQDWTDAYQRHRKNLQLIGLGDPRRWVLKNPSHLFALDELMQVYPDALIVQTHRAPATIIPSMCSLALHATRGYSEVFLGDRIGETQLELWSRGLHRFTEARTRYSPGQFVDIDFADLRADPIGTAETIYTAFGMDLTDDARTAMLALDAEAKTGDRRPEHRYSPADFGLTEAQVTDAFGGAAS
jgi:hypothetical protein